MNFNRGSRTWHSWVGILAALPLLLIISTGLLLQLKKQLAWVQPPEQRESGMNSGLDLERLLTVAKSDPRLGIQGWKDVKRIDIRPSAGIAKISTKNGLEGQIGLQSGRLLQVLPRRSDLIESIHDGSFFAGDVSKLGIFLPAGFALLTLLFTGIWLFILPRRARLRRNRAIRRKLESQGPDRSYGSSRAP